MVRRANFQYQNDQRDQRTKAQIDREEEEYIFEEEASKASETDDFEPPDEDDDDDDEEVEFDNDDDDDDDAFEPAPSRKKRASPRKKPAAQQKRRRARPPSSDEEEEEFQEEAYDESSEEEAAPPPARKRQPAKPAPKPKPAPIYREESSEDDAGDNDSDDKNDDEDFVADEDDDDDDDEEADFDEDDDAYRPNARRATARRKSPTKRGPGRPRKRQVDSDDDDDDEDYNPRARTRKPAKKQQSKRKPAGRKRGRPRKEPVYESSEEEDDYYEEVKPSPRKRGRPAKKAESSDSEEDAKPPARRRGRPPGKKSTKRVDSDDDEEEDEDVDLDDDDEEVIATGRSRAGRRRSVKKKLRSSSEEFELDDDDEDNLDDVDDVFVTKSLRPSRFSAAQATKRLSELSQDDSDNDTKEEEDEEDNDDGDNNKATAAKKPQKGKKKQDALSSDEEFLADSASEPSIEGAAFDSDSEDELDQQGADQEKSREAVNIDNEEVGTAEESSEEEADAEERTNTSSRKEILPENSRIDDSDASVDSEPDRQITGGKEPRMLQCPSTEDCITAEPLPKIHVCCVSPDGSSRQCFALETLRTIALKSSTLQIRVDLDRERQTFLQPPHFRTAMSDDLLDQIASRFGRAALDLKGDFYQTNLDGEPQQPDMFLPGGGMLDNEEELIGRVRRYMDHQMGSQDIYSCPLCYSEMHRRVYRTYRIKADDDESEDEDEEEANEAPSENVYDPMLVLGWLDNEKFEGASVFCFTKVAQLKQHLRDDHHVDTRGIQGNDLYIRYRVRASDGLLQRYLKQARKGFGSFQGDMRRYWNEGNNQTFIYLLELMQRAQYYRTVLNDNDADEEDKEDATDYLTPATRFFESFIDRAKDEWKMTTSPFMKKDDLKDFLVADGDVEEEEGEESTKPAFLAHREMMRADEASSDENDLIHKLERKYAENHGDEAYSDDLSDGKSENSLGDGEDEDDAKEVYSEVSDINGYYSEVEEEDDEWVASIQNKRKGRGNKGKAINGSDANVPTPTVKKLTKRKGTQSTPSPASSSNATPASKRKTILEDSDDEQ